MNVLTMLLKILLISNPMVRKPSLPDLLRSKQNSKLIRISTLNQLYRSLQSNTRRRSKEQMHMLRHDHECMERKLPFPTIGKHSFKEQSRIVLDDE